MGDPRDGGMGYGGPQGCRGWSNTIWGTPRDGAMVAIGYGGPPGREQWGDGGPQGCRGWSNRVWGTPSGGAMG